MYKDYELTGKQEKENNYSEAVNIKKEILAEFLSEEIEHQEKLHRTDVLNQMQKKERGKEQYKCLGIKYYDAAVRTLK